MSRPDERSRAAWEARSKLFGASLRSVLFKGLPDAVNEHLHEWHKHVIFHSVRNRSELRILDVGCGYGRLSMLVIDRFPDAEIIGIDMCETYVKLYLEKTGRQAWVEKVEEIPDRLGAFDYILCVTVLMYLDPERLMKSISSLLAHLKPDGTLILIEPHSSGKPFQTGFGIATGLTRRRGGKGVETGGRCFGAGEIKKLFNLAGGRIVSEERLPFTSVFFLPLSLLGQLLPKGLSKKMFRAVSSLDVWSGGIRLPSIHVAYLIRRNGDGITGESIQL